MECTAIRDVPCLVRNLVVFLVVVYLIEPAMAILQCKKRCVWRIEQTSRTIQSAPRRSRINFSTEWDQNRVRSTLPGDIWMFGCELERTKHLWDVSVRSSKRSKLRPVAHILVRVSNYNSNRFFYLIPQYRWICTGYFMFRKTWILDSMLRFSEFTRKGFTY